MKTLLLMRHAKSSWADERMSDFERPLNSRGERDAPRMGRFLREHGLVPEQVVSSSAVRARSTAELVAAEWDGSNNVALRPNLYHADVHDWKDEVGKLSSTQTIVLCVGHNPGLEAFLYFLTGRDLRMPTAAIAHLTSRSPDWAAFVAAREIVLHDVWCPKELNESDSAISPA